MNFPYKHDGRGYHCMLLLLYCFSVFGICQSTSSMNDNIAYRYEVVNNETRWKEQIWMNRQFLTSKGREFMKREEESQQFHSHSHTSSHTNSLRRTNNNTPNRVRGKVDYQKRTNQQRNLEVDSTVPATLNVLVCLMQWTNHPDRNEAIPVEDYDKLFNGDGRDPDLFPGGTVSDYFETMSYGDFQMNFIVKDWIMTEYTEQQFTADGSQGRTQELQEAFRPVLQRLDDDWFDFGSVDSNNDRVIDMTVFVHSGYDGTDGGVDCETDAKSEQRIASHARAGADESTWVSAEGYRLGPYAVVPAFRDVCNRQIGRIGTIVHEMIHTFGLPEMYDVEFVGQYGTGNIGGIDRFGVMANTGGNSGGNLAWPGHVGAWTRLELGWVDPIVIGEDGTYEIRPIEKHPDLYKITKGFTENEYLLIENRQSIEGDFDEKFFTPGGIVIYHVDENIWDLFKYDMGPKGNYPRGGTFQDDWPGNGRHYPVAILQADGLYELEQGINGGQSADLWNKPTQELGPGNGEKVATEAGVYPNTDSYANGIISPTGVTIRNFQMKPGDDSKTMTFQVCGIDSDDCPDLTEPNLPETDQPTKAPRQAPTEIPTKDLTVPPTTGEPQQLTTAPTKGEPQQSTTAPTKGEPQQSTTAPTKGEPLSSPAPTNVEPLLTTAPQVVNDNCAKAITASIDGTIIEGNDAGARPVTSTNGPPCGVESAGLWYKVTGTGRTLRATTCLPGTNHPTQIHVLSGSCDDLSCISVEANNYAACSDLMVATNSATVNWNSEEGTEYLILVGSRDESSVGDFELKITEFVPVENDQCTNATELSLNSDIIGSTIEATTDFAYDTEYCGLPLETAGVWYVVEGSGNGMSFSTCQNNNYNSAVSVFTGSDCNNLQCLMGVATPDPLCSYTGVTAAWMSQTNETYYIYVHGIAQNSYGTFEAVVEDFEVDEPNEFCQQATPLTENESNIQASTKDATHTAPTNACGVEVANPGLWYTFDGNGYPYEISACAQDDTDIFDVSISLFTGDDCGELRCLSGDTFADQLCSSNSGEEASISSRFLQNSTNSTISPSSISIDSEEDVTYYVLVHGQDPSLNISSPGNGVGGFNLVIRSQIPPTLMPTIVPTSISISSPSLSPSLSPTSSSGIGTDLDESEKSEKNKNLNYLYLLLLLLLVPPLWYFREKVCFCLPRANGEDEILRLDTSVDEEAHFRDESNSEVSDSENIDSGSESESESESGSDSEAESDSEADSENDMPTVEGETSPPWQTLS